MLFPDRRAARRPVPPRAIAPHPPLARLKLALAPALALSLAAGSGCSWRPWGEKGKSFTLRIQVPRIGSRKAKPDFTAASVPATINDFTCVGVNVSADDITPASETQGCRPTGMPALGAYAGLVPVGSGATIELLVPSGPGRIVQVFGLTSSNGTCPTLESLIRGQTSLSGFDSPYEVGRATLDITSDSDVTVTAAWDPSSPKRAFCLSPAALGTLSFSAPATIVSPGTTVTFAATGGLSPYAYAMSSGAGSIDAATGVYTAPGTTASATVQVTDALGSKATASFSVTYALWDSTNWNAANALWAP